MLDAQQSGQVCILMGVYNGARDLGEQLESFVDQTHSDWHLIASDDGSSDDSIGILERFQAEQGQTTVIEGPRQGLAVNFLSMIAATPESADWLAFSDQDDVWLPDRLERGIAQLAGLPGDKPALYCSRTWITDSDLGNKRVSVDYTRSPGFRNALVQNIAAGNTILLNRAALDLAREAAPEAMGIAGLSVHDWWLYQLVTGAGGTVIRDQEPTLYYRQHAGNQIGANDSWRARAFRIGMIFKGGFAEWNTANIAALRASAGRLTPENRAVLEEFAALREQSLPLRLWRFLRSGIYRQTAGAQAAMWLALVLKRL